MRNLLRAQWYRFWHYPLFRHFIIPVCLVCVLFSVLFEKYSVTTGSGLNGCDTLRTLPNCYMFLCLFALPVLVHTVCSSFRNKTVHQEQLAGYGSHSVLLSRLLVGTGITVLFTLVFMVLAVGFNTWQNGWMDADPEAVPDTKKLSDYLLGAAICIFATAQTVAACILFTCMIQETGFALLLSLAAPLGLPFLETVDAPLLLSLVSPGNAIMEALAHLLSRSSSMITFYSSDYTLQLPFPLWCAGVLLLGMLNLVILYAITRFVLRKRLGMEH